MDDEGGRRRIKDLEGIMWTVDAERPSLAR